MAEEAGKKSDDIKWHLAVQAALWDYFAPYRSFVDIIWERQLTSEPLIMDGLIIKKDPAMTIPNLIGSFFKTWNVVEYKSPDDSFGVEDLRKLLAYVNLLAMEKGVRWEDITITIIRTGEAKSLFSYLRKKPGCVIEKQVDAQGNYVGIYRISGYADIAIQVIQSEKLPEQDALFLKHLRTHLNLQTLVSLLKKSDEHDSLEAYFHVLLKANDSIYKEVLSMAFDEVTQMLADSPVGKRIIAEAERRIERRLEQERQKAEQQRAELEQQQQRQRAETERQRQAVMQCLQELGLSAEQQEAVRRSMLQVEVCEPQP